MKEENLIDVKQKYQFYIDVAGIRMCNLYQEASGLSNIELFHTMRGVLIVFQEGWTTIGSSAERKEV